MYPGGVGSPASDLIDGEDEVVLEVGGGNVRRRRGENWLLVSCSVTIVIEKTKPVNVIIELAIADSRAWAPSTPLLIKNGN